MNDRPKDLLDSIPARIALIGDHDPAVTAHQAIPKALALARAAARRPIEWSWIHTTELRNAPERLDSFAAAWCVPASPYANQEGAIAAIRFARESALPFLGTCGGFQHALLEHARAVWNLPEPAHAELDPRAADPVISQLECSLVEQTGQVFFVPGSRLAAIYGQDRATEGYHCRYGLNPKYAGRLATGRLRPSAHDSRGEVRAVELDGHPFFMATLFQPERSALEGRGHPLIQALVTAAIATAADPFWRRPRAR